ncbi:HAMP domain-containing histidine kinase [Bacillus timonensis]|uniref:histidine kinase n=1 Tax=Bacillus timonensis TaxID=1033734 RepID=A0A4S3PS09_9BACI|nr:HAMP domain-containing sensor histidine kinase [Bacillus timonensis]THE12490.1 HAMP domain-containing histidine kinase [Bacillus timonensis]
MATKWKGKITIGLIGLLFTFGLGGFLSVIANGSDYIYQDYFHTPYFQEELGQFAGYVSMYELFDLTEEEAKDSIVVTEDEINEHRYRYGDLPQQIENINLQYEERIQDALNANYQDIADTYITERDQKIEDITKNFKSDNYVKNKIIKEKEKKVEEFYKAKDGYKSQYETFKKKFLYYFKNPTTRQIYTNIKRTNEDSIETAMTEESTYFLKDYTITREDFIHLGPYPDSELLESIIPADIGILEGKIAVSTTLAASNPLMIQYNTFKQSQLILLVTGLASILSFLICFILGKKVQAVRTEIEKWRPYYNKLPIDSRVIFFILTGLISIFCVFFAVSEFYYVLINLYNAVEPSVALIIGSCFVGLTYLQGKYLLTELKDWQNVKTEWENGLVSKAKKEIIVLFKKGKQRLKDAFLNQSTGTQFFVILVIIFGLGFGVVFILLKPVFILFYVLFLAVVGIPLLITLVKKLGYFNKIVEKTNELAAGKLGEDLPVNGKSVFETLASNINLLKHGVKTSQNEQAKSERLKTELITNVSHDLRTPLTSIITYTELMKTQNLSDDDRAAYLEIIDRKSKRLKVLIDDLFEVSKMASGNIELNLEKVDLVQLLQQALAEHDDTINASNLQFRVTNSEKPLYALVDGQKMWRVFDNLLGNIFKYSLEHSRVYISTDRIEEQAIITFKNVSKYELSENSDELFERFKRGDTSRHTDGSGLGLAIAQSIVDLHHGTLEIETDGDLFKVKITLALM